MSVKPPALLHLFHPPCQPNQAPSLKEEWDDSVSLHFLFKSRDGNEQHTLVEVPFFASAKLNELLDLGPNRPFDFLFPFTIVDGSQEDDISITRKESELKERSSFRSLFETERCPAPFILGSRFYCFHSPGMECFYDTGGSLRKVQDMHSFYPALGVSHCSHAEMPSFFKKPHDYKIYSEDVEFINGLMNTKTRGLVLYQLTLTLWRMACETYYWKPELEVLKLTKHPEDCSIKARWRVKGIPWHSILVFYHKKDKSQLFRTHDAFSTFYIGDNGRITCHKVEKVMKAQPPLLPKATSVLAGALVALGIQDDRPVFNSIPLLLSSICQHVPPRKPTSTTKDTEREEAL
ncbi:hypothetical protein DNTS_007985 [Danionella cerebrum]|uniref:Uncharacterized protein n=1 Tax=Danionella cerebrum TaxID=2873325 RepID=A0A553NMH9_9TELE|nr:hypothetical protein DNTS_007985 [Danionella translucida]TRY66646.1 hypothetical protein DNTS_007985 [Danionella translucida]